MLVPLVIVLTCCLQVLVSASTPKERLLRDLMNDYAADVDPGNITLKISIRLICASWDSTTGFVTNNVWEYHAWKDERLKWNPAEHNGLDSIRVPVKLLWTPDTAQYYSVSTLPEREGGNAVLEADGSLLWIPRATYHIPCTTEGGDISCNWRFGSWTYDGINVLLEPEGEDPLDVSVYNDKCPLSVVSHKAAVVSHVYPCCEEPYPSLDATVVFRPRQSTVPTQEPALSSN